MRIATVYETQVARKFGFPTPFAQLALLRTPFNILVMRARTLAVTTRDLRYFSLLLLLFTILLPRATIIIIINVHRIASPTAPRRAAARARRNDRVRCGGDRGKSRRGDGTGGGGAVENRRYLTTGFVFVVTLPPVMFRDGGVKITL